ncbi:MAG: flagellar biosynthesis protein FliQ [Firmicutes bacterium]|nr:flagellar biosynthesis protein FliQ [Bacillota bacterium]
MTDTFIIDIIREALFTVIILALPTLAVALLVGLTVGLLQATTQVQEQSLAFVPKIIAVLVSLAVTAPWLIRVITEFATKIFSRLPDVLG